MDPGKQFAEEKAARLAQETPAALERASLEWLAQVSASRYVYNFSWLGRPVIQLPQDLVAVQELIWDIQPELVVETGVAHGGSLIFHASVLNLLGGERRVIGIDIDIRSHNRRAIEQHFLGARIDLVQGSSIDAKVAEKVFEMVRGRRVLLILDSNHTHEHVLRELELYTPLVSKGSYCVVFDTLIEYLPEALFTDRPWRKGNSPASAVAEFLRGCDRFEVDRSIDRKLLLSAAPGGYLRCIKD